MAQAEHDEVAHLHLGGRYPPFCCADVELGPFGLAQLAWSDEDKRSELQREPRDGLPFETVDSAQQRAYGVRFNDRCPVSDRGRDQRAAEIS